MRLTVHNHRRRAADVKRAIIDLPSDAEGMFIEPDVVTPEIAVVLAHNLERSVNHVAYADEFTGGTYDPIGRYNCGRCNQEERSDCLLLDINGINEQAGSCRDWEPERTGDPEMRLKRKSPDAASYGVAKNGVGFGCHRCPFVRTAKNVDSQGRSSWCGENGHYVTPTACCELNGAPTV